MLLHISRIIAVTLLSGCCCKGVELLTNGDFETGSLSGWTTAEQNGDGYYSVVEVDDLVAPISFVPISGNGAGGVYHAVSDMGGPASNVLAQTFTIGSTPANVILTFQMFVDDHSGSPIVDDTTMDITGPSNQHARVDILTGGAGLFDTGVTVLDTLFIGADAGTPPNAFTPYSFNITSVVSTPGTYTLRFATVANQNTLTSGVDNVSIDFQGIPEPSSFLLLLGGPALLLLKRPSRRRC